jgi:hypothetical protein
VECDGIKISCWLVSWDLRAGRNRPPSGVRSFSDRCINSIVIAMRHVLSLTICDDGDDDGLGFYMFGKMAGRPGQEPWSAGRRMGGNGRRGCGSDGVCMRRLHPLG